MIGQDFEEHRVHLRGVAYRMLGSLSEADDAVQEAWLRLDRTDAGDVRNLRAWLTTVVARICLDMLRARSARPEQPLDEALNHVSAAYPVDPVDPEQEAVLADSIGVALLVILQTLSPAERLAFVLHDMFDLPFSEIAPMVGRSENTAAQLAARARRSGARHKPLRTQRISCASVCSPRCLSRPLGAARTVICSPRSTTTRRKRRRHRCKHAYHDPRRRGGGDQCAHVRGQCAISLSRPLSTTQSASSSRRPCGWLWCCDSPGAARRSPRSQSRPTRSGYAS